MSKMKLLLEQWREFVNEEASPSVMYHATLQPKNAESIEANGLLVGAHLHVHVLLELDGALVQLVSLHVGDARVLHCHLRLVKIMT